LTDRTLLLFDIDGVLIHPQGYKESLRATVDYFAAQMGQSPVGLTYEENAFFEACGMTNEWISGPMVVAAMLVDAVSQRPDLARPTLDETLAAIRESGICIRRPELIGLSREVLARNPEGVHTEEPVLAYLAERAVPALHAVLSELLEDIHPPDAPVARIFQHYTLGHELFAETYGMPPEFETESFLVKEDRSALTPEIKRRLQDLIAADNYGMVALTARPSLPPADLSPEERATLDRERYPPEGELALELLGLEADLPLIASGRMIWLSTQRNQGSHTYVKPSPVHALAAIGAARTGHEKAALEAAATLVEEGCLEEPLARLEGETTRVVVFEDATGGIQAGRRAVEMLNAAGIEAGFEAVGVAPEESKREALSKAADRVARDVNEALEPYLA
jgi:hypothetical protein